ncbi:hypothetical protein THRCLA_11643, partial [Thraustotheca clavata]
MGTGLPAVERLVGALITLAFGVTVYVVHQVLTPKVITMDEYHQQKYKDTKDMIGHRGSCSCGAMTFVVLAPRKICAFDDSNAFPSKKGRIPVMIVPMTHLQMTSQSTEISDPNSFVSIYTHHVTPTYASQHVFCKRCGIHLFHMELNRTDRVAINVHCIDEDYIDDLRVVFVPKGGRPIFERVSVEAIEEYKSSTAAKTLHNSLPQKTISTASAFQRQIMAWSKLQARAEENPVESSPISTKDSPQTDDDVKHQPHKETTP